MPPSDGVSAVRPLPNSSAALRLEGAACHAAASRHLDVSSLLNLGAVVRAAAPVFSGRDRPC